MIVKKERVTKMKRKTVYLDMDGTIADLYGINNWLERLRNEDHTIFEECEPFISESDLMNYFPTEEYEIRICSMTPKNATKEYCEDVKKQKNAWLDKFFPNIKKRYYLPYGNNKNYKNSKDCILVDDNKNIRENYRGLALYPQWL